MYKGIYIYIYVDTVAIPISLLLYWYNLHMTNLHLQSWICWVFFVLLTLLFIVVCCSRVGGFCVSRRSNSLVISTKSGSVCLRTSTGLQLCQDLSWRSTVRYRREQLPWERLTVGGCCCCWWWWFLSLWNGFHLSGRREEEVEHQRPVPLGMLRKAGLNVCLEWI